VSRSFTYQNKDADALIAAAQTRSRATAAGDLHAVTAQQEASWRERALNAEDRVRDLNREIGQERQLVADLLGQLRDPDGTWLAEDRAQLREENQRLLADRNQMLATQRDLQRRLDGARANISRLTSARVTQLFPDGLTAAIEV
jgi:chromosome segregation ATPase